MGVLPETRGGNNDGDTTSASGKKWELPLCEKCGSVSDRVVEAKIVVASPTAVGIDPNIRDGGLLEMLVNIITSVENWTSRYIGLTM